MGFVLSWCFAWLVWLLCACRVRRFKGLWRICLRFYSSLPLFYPFFIFFALLVSFCPSLCSRCSCCLLLVLLPCLVFPALFLCFLSPLRMYRNKKGRKVFPLRPLFVCCGFLYPCVVIKEFRCRYFRSFQLVRLVFPTDAAWVGWLARSYFDFLRHNVDITNYRSAFLK